MENIKVGIFGGTFDPIHKGHLLLAKAAKNEANLEKILFLPLNVPPHKPKPIATGKQRLDMIKKAIACYDGFEVSDMELKRSGTTYTIDTVKELKAKHKNWDIYYLIGQDSLLYLDQWKDTENLFKICNFICMLRPGEKSPEEKLKEYKAKYKAKIQIIKQMGLYASSTNIRKGAKDQVPKEIIKDVEKIYYRKDNPLTDRAKILSKLKELISEERYAHTISTEKKAIELAKIHGYDTEKASLAAILHDCAKNISKDKEGFCKEHNLSQYLDSYSSYPLCVLHAPMGAHLAREEFGIKDEEILSAITWHTSGKADMSTLDKIIYLADYTEETRPKVKEIQEVRELSEKDLDKAMELALQYSIKKIEAKGFPVHKDTIEAYEYYKTRGQKK